MKSNNKLYFFISVPLIAVFYLWQGSTAVSAAISEKYYTGIFALMISVAIISLILFFQYQKNKNLKEEKPIKLVLVDVFIIFLCSCFILGVSMLTLDFFL